MTLFIPAMWAIIRFFHTAAHLTLVTSGVMARELAAQVGGCPMGGTAGEEERGATMHGPERAPPPGPRPAPAADLLDNAQRR